VSATQPLRSLFAGLIALGTLVLGAAVPAHAAESVPIQTWRLDNGARVLFVHRPQLPMTSLRVVFDAGSARDPEGKFGLSALTARMLDEGAGEMSPDAFARKVDDLGIQFSASNSQDTLAVQVTSLTEGETTQRAWDLLAQALTEPAFPERSLKRERQRQLVGIRRDEEDPQRVAIKAFYRAVYGEHPYAHPSDGVPGQVRKLERPDLAEFAANHFVGQNATIALVGDLAREEAERLLAKTLGRLPGGEAPDPLPPVPALEEAQEVFLKRDVAQAHVLMGQPGAEWGATDYFPLLVGNYSLGGGGFASRLMGAVREEEGLSYSVFSTFHALARRGPFVAGLQTANAKVEKALGILRSEVATYVAEGPTADEVEAAQRYLTGSFPLRIESNQDIVGQLTTMGFYGLGMDYLDRFRERVRAVDGAAIRQAMGERLDPDRMVTVIVGAQRPEGFGQGAE